jgi:hypothetical protein
MLLSKHGHTIKAMRSDYGAEYFNMRTEHWCAKHHVSNSSSSPHRHHQNSKPERFWQTLWNMNRASIDYMHEHESMWSIATNCNEFIRNVMPIGRDSAIPYTTVTGRTFDHRALRTPLSACFSMRENEILNSHENKREQMVFAGYDYSIVPHT